MSWFSDFVGNGGAPAQAWSPPSIPERFLNPSPVPEMQINDVRRGILSDKRGWDEANKNMNLFAKSLENPDLSDDQKQAINDNIQGWQRARDAFAASANERRANAQALGIDVSDYDSGKTLTEAAQAYSTYRNNAVKDFLNLPTVAQLEENRYLELRNRGASPAQADRILKRERAGREEEFLRRTEEGIMTYGTNPDGSLNQIGLQLTRRMNPSDPQIAAALYTTAFATPKNIFEANNQRDLAILGNESAMARTQAQILATMRNAEADRIARAKILQATLQNQREIEEGREAGRNARADAEIRSREQIELAKLQAGSPAYKFGEYYNLGLELFGGDKERATAYALRETSKWKPGENKVSAAQGVLNLYDTMFSYIAQGDEDSAGNLLHELTAKQEQKLDEFGAEFTPEENRQLDDLRGAFSEYLNFTPTSSDPNEINKQKAEALKRLMAKYRAAKRGTSWNEEYTAISQANAVARHNGRENPTTPYNDYDRANGRVRELLSPDKPKPTRPYTPPPVGSWTGHYGGY